LFAQSGPPVKGQEPEAALWLHSAELSWWVSSNSV
jgi:hypothetical protein